MTYTITDYLIDLYRDDSTVEPNFSSDTDEQAYAIHLHNCYCQKEQNYRFVDVSEQNQMTLRYDDIADYVIKANAIITLNDVHWVYDKGLGLYRPNDNDIESTILKILEECGYSQKNPIKHASQETMHRISSKTTLKECPFDHDQRTILVKNGVLDLETRALLPFSPAYGFTRNLNVTYDPDANSTPIRAYLNSLVATERDVALLLQMVAQAITQAQIKKSYICYNKSGNNGKSTYLNLVRDFLGPSKVSSLSLQDICKGGFRTANIEGKWANIYPDLPKETIWDDSTFKAITGNDTIPVERKYEQAHDYANNAPFMFGTNEFPTINTSSNAFYNRFYLIEFPNQFPVDPKFNEKLFTEINKSALLNLVLEAVWNLKQNGPIPQSEDAILKNTW
jgi:putative DNA primase/helicase